MLANKHFSIDRSAITTTCYNKPLSNPHKRIERALQSSGYSIRRGTLNGRSCPRLISPKDNQTW